MSDASRVAQALGGHRSGSGWLCRCPAPGHGRGQGDRNPSLLLRDGDRRLLVRCLAGCRAQEVLDQLRCRGLLGKAAGSSRPACRPVPAAPRLEAPAAPAALALWRASVSISGTLAERYLRHHRGLPPHFPPSLRFLREVCHPRLRSRHPALIAAVQAPGGQLVAVQLTLLAADGAKAMLANPRLTFGSLGEGAIRLGEARTLLGLAEGTEDALSAMAETGCPCWAVAGASRLHRVALPDRVREIHLFIDDDRAGRDAAERSSRHYAMLGRRVVVHLPPSGFKDWGALAEVGNRWRAVA